MIIISSIIFCSISFSCFYFIFKSNKFRLSSGLFFNVFLLSLLVLISSIIISANNEFLERILLLSLAVIVIIISLVFSFLGIFLLVNAFIVWKKESHTIGNMLTLFLGITILLVPMILNLINLYLKINYNSSLEKNIISTLFDIYNGLLIYIIFWFINFISSFLITKIFSPSLDKKYIIVLGSGLINGTEVSPLLASRILAAKKFADKQYLKNKIKPMIIFSGGKGADEHIAEGVAMKNYAIKNNMSRYNLISEDKAKNTLENMLFSKKIIIKNSIPIEKGIFVTSDYHTFRAAGYARYVGLDIDGIGSKTSKYFIPNAFLREYIAILMNHKYFHMAMISIIIFVPIIMNYIVLKFG